MNELIDFHCHLDLYNNFEHVVRECESRKIFTLAVTTTPRAWPKNLELSQNTKYVRAALGLHPQLITHDTSELDIWKKYFPNAKYIGEIGLDASPRFYSYFKEQQEVFDAILFKCSQVGGKILSVHSVRCASKVLSAIKNNGTHLNNNIVLHWFTGSLSDARKAIELGCYFSVNSVMAQSENGKRILTVIPIERLLTETDGPFTTHKGNTQYSWDVIHCIELLAKIYGKGVEEMKTQIYRNLGVLLK